MVQIEISGKSLIIKADSVVIDNIRNAFSQDKEFHDASNPYADSKEYVITKGGSFHVGLLSEVENYLLANRIKYQITDEARNRFQTRIPAIIAEKLNGINYRDYQYGSIHEAFTKGRGIIELPTSAGKTAVMGGICKTFLTNNKGKILIVVPNKILLYQAQKDFLSFGIDDFTLFSGETKETTDWTKSIVITTFALIVQRKKTKQTNVKKRPFLWLNRFKDFDIIMVDEVHQLANKSTSILKFVANCTTNHKFGFTGTLPDDQIQKWNIIGRIGPVIYREKSITMREMGYISDVRVKIIKFIHNYVPPAVDQDSPPTFLYHHEKEFLMKCDKRNNFAVKLCNKSENNVLILVDRIEHGEILERLISDQCSNKTVFFAFGKTPSDEREEIKRIMENNDNVVCVAITKLFSTGVSINNLPWVIMMGIGKSKIQLFQTIGRSLRLHKNKTVATIFDFADNTFYSDKHLMKRNEFYATEQINCKNKEIQC